MKRKGRVVDRTGGSLHIRSTIASHSNNKRQDESRCVYAGFLDVDKAFDHVDLHLLLPRLSRLRL